MAKNLQEVGDTYHALLVEPKDVRSILGRSRFNRGTKCKSVKNAEITANLGSLNGSNKYHKPEQILMPL
jgi:hypothetical protein